MASVGLRPILPRDYEAFWAALSDPEIRAAVPGSNTITTPDGARAGIEEFISRTENGTEFHRAISLVDGTFAGMVAIYDFQKDTARIGYWVAKEHQGKGYATCAAGDLLRLASEKFGLKRLLATTKNGNVPSIRLLDRLGFKELYGKDDDLNFYLEL